MSTFKHAGIDITLDGTGKFFATVNGVRVRKPSLDAMKKHIDESAKMKFEPFTAITDEEHSDDKKARVAKEYVRVQVVGIGKDEGRYSRGDNAFRIIRPGRTEPQQPYRAIFEDSPDSIAALLALDAHRAETRKIKEQRDREEEALRKKLRVLDPKKYGRTK